MDQLVKFVNEVTEEPRDRILFGPTMTLYLSPLIGARDIDILPIIQNIKSPKPIEFMYALQNCRSSNTLNIFYLIPHEIKVIDNTISDFTKMRTNSLYLLPKNIKEFRFVDHSDEFVFYDDKLVFTYTKPSKFSKIIVMEGVNKNKVYKNYRHKVVWPQKDEYIILIKQALRNMCSEHIIRFLEHLYFFYDINSSELFIMGFRLCNIHYFNIDRLKFIKFDKLTRQQIAGKLETFSPEICAQYKDPDERILLLESIPENQITASCLTLMMPLTLAEREIAIIRCRYYEIYDLLVLFNNEITPESRELAIIKFYPTETNTYDDFCQMLPNMTEEERIIMIKHCYYGYDSNDIFDLIINFEPVDETTRHAMFRASREFLPIFLERLNLPTILDFKYAMRFCEKQDSSRILQIAEQRGFTVEDILPIKCETNSEQILFSGTNVLWILKRLTNISYDDIEQFFRIEHTCNLVDIVQYVTEPDQKIYILRHCIAPRDHQSLPIMPGYYHLLLNRCLIQDITDVFKKCKNPTESDKRAYLRRTRRNN